MTDAPAESPVGTERQPDGIVCRECRSTIWRVTRTRPGMGCVRRWRVCASCGHRCRTRETIEADAHPDQ